MLETNGPDTPAVRASAPVLPSLTNYQISFLSRKFSRHKGEYTGLSAPSGNFHK